MFDLEILGLSDQSIISDSIEDNLTLEKEIIKF